MAVSVHFTHITDNRGQWRGKREGGGGEGRHWVWNSANICVVSSDPKLYRNRHGIWHRETQGGIVTYYSF